MFTQLHAADAEALSLLALPTAPLQPAVLPGESANYVDGVSAEAQMMYDISNPMARAKAR